MISLSEIAARLFASTPATIFSTLGGLMLLGTMALAYRAIRLLIGARTGGTIIGWHEKTLDRVTSYAPIFRFQAGTHGAFVVQSSTIWRDQAGDINVPVTVLYDPAAPNRADIYGDHHPWRPVLAMVVLTAGVFAVAWKATA